MLLTSSGSSFSLIAVKPEMSAKTTVTCLRAETSSGADATEAAEFAPSTEPSGTCVNVFKPEHNVLTSVDIFPRCDVKSLRVAFSLRNSDRISSEVSINRSP